MTSHGPAATTRPHPRLLARLWHRRRAVRVSVLVHGHEADRFEAESPATLRPALRALYAHLPRKGTAVRFTAVAEEALPLGLGRYRFESDLAGPASALAFLAGVPPTEECGEAEPARELALAREDLGGPG